MRKEKWWKQVLLGWKSEPFLSIAVALGVGVFTSGVVSGAFNWPYVFGGKWWEVMTAVGTIGAVIVALLFGLRSEIEKNLIREAELISSATRISYRLSSVAQNLKAILDSLESSENISSWDKKRLCRLWWISKITDTDVAIFSRVNKSVHGVISAREELIVYLETLEIPQDHDAWSIDSNGIQKIHNAWSDININKTLRDMLEFMESIVEITYVYGIEKTK